VAVVTGRDLDKNWTVCDNTATSPYFGRCYISTSFVNGVAYPVFVVAHPPNSGILGQAMYTVQGGLNPMLLPTTTLAITSEADPCPATFLPLLFHDSAIHFH
jgi:hypothetical protein